MTKKVVGIRFKKAGKIYYFDPLDLKLSQYDHVVVETVQGVEYGEVALPPREIDEAMFSNPVKPVVRKATPRDDEDYAMLKDKEKQARSVFEEKVKFHKLDMKLINVEYTFDKKKAIFYFTAEGRVDFRSLVKDLAAVFRVRIELRQIGVRDEAKIFNTLGVCGRNTCCSQWLGDFTPVSIKMAKEQNMSLNSTKISGICGRLLCCLTYEHDFYKNVTKKMPKVGQMVETPDGVGQVFRLGVLQESVLVRMQVGNDDTEIRTYAMDDVTKSDAPRPTYHQNSRKGDRPSKPDRSREEKPGEDKEKNQGEGSRKESGNGNGNAGSGNNRKPRPQGNKRGNNGNSGNSGKNKNNTGGKNNNNNRRRKNRNNSEKPGGKTPEGSDKKE